MAAGLYRKPATTGVAILRTMIKKDTLYYHTLNKNIIYNNTVVVVVVSLTKRTNFCIFSMTCMQQHAFN
jgi:hypothetical protein